MTEEEKRSDRVASRIGIVIVLIFAITILTFILYGDVGLKMVLAVLVLSLLGALFYFVYDYASNKTARDMGLGATLVTRHDYVDAYGDANIEKARHGGGNQMLPPPESQEFRLLPKVDHSDTGEFEIDKFKLPTNVSKN